MFSMTGPWLDKAPFRPGRLAMSKLKNGRGYWKIKCDIKSMKVRRICGEGIYPRWAAKQT
jgi:hypothetical protein